MDYANDHRSEASQPQRPLNGYNLFYGDFRRGRGTLGGLISLTKAVAKAWENLDPDERDRYNSAGRALQEQYRVQKESFRLAQQQDTDRNVLADAYTKDTSTYSPEEIREHILRLKRVGVIQDAVCVKTKLRRLDSHGTIVRTSSSSVASTNNAADECFLGLEEHTVCDGLEYSSASEVSDSSIVHADSDLFSLLDQLDNCWDGAISMEPLEDKEVHHHHHHQGNKDNLAKPPESSERIRDDNLEPIRYKGIANNNDCHA